MRKLLLVVALSALVFTWADAVAGAELPPGTIGYQMSYTGLVYLKYSDTGLQQNANCPQINNGLVAYQHTSTIKLAWNAEFKFAFNPKATHSAISRAKRTSVHGSSFRYTGFTYNDSCQKVPYGGASGCTGVLINHGRATAFARLTKQRKNEDMKFDIAPFGALSANPSTCDGQSAADTLNLAVLAEDFTSHVFSTVERIGRGVNRTAEWKLDNKKNCSVTGGLPGETDQCSSTTTGTAFFDIHPLG
jgi:hypothetical protein